MTKNEFDAKYPVGLNKIIYNINKAVFNIFTTDEIEKVIKSEKWYRRKKLRKLAGYLKDVKSIDDVPHYLALLSAIDSPMLFRDIITYAVMFSDDVYKGEDLE